MDEILIGFAIGGTLGVLWLIRLELRNIRLLLERMGKCEIIPYP